jgi:hypothetical protein
MVRAVAFAALAAGFAAPAARAQQIVHAQYDASRDVLLVDVAYRGTSARLSDLEGRDAARHDYRMRLRIDLDELPCRPVRATLRLGRVSHVTVMIPEAP